MADYNFDDSNINWQQLAGFDHLRYFIFAVDRENKIVDALFKFSANEKIALHRHVALNHMLVIQGEHRLYEPGGDIKEVRPTGRYTVSPASDEPHREGGGEQEGDLGHCDPLRLCRGVFFVSWWLLQHFQSFKTST